MVLLRLCTFISLCAFLVTVTEGDLYAQDRFIADHSESRLWIEGSSNVNRFDCTAEEYTGDANTVEVTNSETTTELSLKIDIPVDGFECGRSRMNRDLRNALKSDQYPNITFVFEHAELANDNNNNNEFISFSVTGNLTVAGVTRKIRFVTEGKVLENDKMRARGSKKIRMSDFGVEPPTGLFGLVKADDELTVHFDLTAKRITE
jgi:hypothetical protein